MTHLIPMFVFALFAEITVDAPRPTTSQIAEVSASIRAAARQIPNLPDIELPDGYDRRRLADDRRAAINYLRSLRQGRLAIFCTSPLTRDLTQRIVASLSKTQCEAWLVHAMHVIAEEDVKRLYFPKQFQGYSMSIADVAVAAANLSTNLNVQRDALTLWAVADLRTTTEGGLRTVPPIPDWHLPDHLRCAD